MNGHWLFTQKPTGEFAYQCSSCGAYCSGAYRMCPRCKSVNLNTIIDEGDEGTRGGMIGHETDRR